MQEALGLLSELTQSDIDWILEQGAEQQVIANTLLDHTARGERARIARELHDVVAHHISMIAVQAEAARLATPGMPAAGALTVRKCPSIRSFFSAPSSK